MAGHYSRVKPPCPRDNNDNLSSLYSRPSIQNSPDWPSVKLRSPGPSVQTLNQSDGGTYCDDMLSLANLSNENIDPSVRSSVFTANMLAWPSSTCPSTPSGSSRGQYQPLPVSLEKSGEWRRVGGPTQSSPSIHADLVPPLQSTPNGDVEGRSKYSSECHQPVSTNDTAM
jgi:hypothetical protein